MDALSYAWKARLTAVLDSGKAALHAAATPALEDIDDYGVLEDKLATGKQALSDIFADVSARLTALAASAANESAWNGTTVEPGKDASGVYQIAPPRSWPGWPRRSTIPPTTLRATAPC